MPRTYQKFKDNKSQGEIFKIICTYRHTFGVWSCFHEFKLNLHGSDGGRHFVSRKPGQEFQPNATKGIINMEVATVKSRAVFLTVVNMNL